jgi:hypothetical protein
VDPHALAETIATKVVAATDFWVAVIGFIGVAVGALIGVGGTLLLHWMQSRPKSKLDRQRTTLLTSMLEDTRFPNRWRKLSTMARVIGASEATTTRLLIGLSARGSENDDGLWGLVKHHPLDKTGQ